MAAKRMWRYEIDAVDTTAETADGLEAFIRPPAT
jgi:hypothetical protein